MTFARSGSLGHPREGGEQSPANIAPGAWSVQFRSALRIFAFQDKPLAIRAIPFRPLPRALGGVVASREPVPDSPGPGLQPNVVVRAIRFHGVVNLKRAA